MFCLIDNINLINNKNSLNILNKKHHKFFIIKEVDYKTAKNNKIDKIVIKLNNINLEKINYLKEQLNIYKSKIERIRKLFNFKIFSEIKNLKYNENKFKKENKFKTLNLEKNNKKNNSFRNENNFKKLTPINYSEKFKSKYYINFLYKKWNDNKKNFNKFKTLFK